MLKREHMSPARKEDESVLTSLRDLMKQEEERVRTEAERLEQLRAAKARIDRERAEAAREALERAAEAEREAQPAAVIEPARIEAVAKVEVQAAPPRATKSRFSVGFALGIAVATCVTASGWFAGGAPRLKRDERTSASLRAQLDEEQARAADARRASGIALDNLQRDNDALRAENARLAHLLEQHPRTVPKAPTATPRPPAPKSTCVDPHDPLCSDLP